VTLAPLLAAPPLIQFHVFAALGALFLGLVQFALPKGTAVHRLSGRIWVGLMAAVALSSFGITGAGGAGRWSWIHLISLYTLAALLLAMRQAQRGKVRAHRISMISLFLGALIITGAFTLLPGRLMHGVVFGG